MSKDRMARVNKAIMEALAELIPGGIRDPRAHQVDTVAVTSVRTTPDLRFARVQVSITGKQEAIEPAFGAIRAAAAYLRGELGHRVRMRHVPELDLVLDTTADSAARIEEILGEIAQERAVRHVAEEAADELDGGGDGRLTGGGESP